jgi:DivIVA domain-containing protein
VSPQHPLVSELDIRRVEQRSKELPFAGYRRGYRVAQVDGFLRQVVVSLRALLAENEGLRAGVDPGNLWHQGASVSSPRTPADVAAQTFELARSGSAYRMREVDELLDEVIHLLTRLEAENELLRAQSTLR